MFKQVYGEAGWSSFTLNRTTYDELQSTGQIRLIQDTNSIRLVAIGAAQTELSNSKALIARIEEAL